MTVALSLDDPRRRFPAYAAAMALAAGGAWVASRARGRGAVALAVAAICARLWALSLPPALSEDLFRYVYEGRVALAYGPTFAFTHPPADGPALGVPPALLDAAWLRINHASIPTLYPPLAQATFALAAGIGELLGGAHAVALKALLVAAELAGIAAVARADRRAGLALLLLPLSITEIAREGHADALALAGLAMGAAALVRARPRAAAIGFALAALGKLIGALPLLVPLGAAPRRAWPGAALLALTAVPYAVASTAGLHAYGTSWQGGEGAFSLLWWAAQAALGGTWARVGELTLTAAALARGATAIAFVACAAVAWRRTPGALADRAGLWVLLALLWAPTMHPWYVLWLAPFAALCPRWAPPMVWLLATAPLLHHPGWLALDSGVWTDLPALRAAVHVPAWALLVWRSRLV